MSEYVHEYLNEAICVLMAQNPERIERCVQLLVDLKKRGGRLFVLGIGGGAANASHAVNDFRKLCGIEAYAPTDNVAELTARTNDDGWLNTFPQWLAVSHLGRGDMVLFLSVGGGTSLVSQNIAAAASYARSRRARIIAIVGKRGGEATRLADEWLMAPTLNHERITPHAEEFQAVMWHLMANHPDLKSSSLVDS